MACCGGHETANAWNLFEHTALVESNQSQLLEIRRVHLVLQAYLNAKADEKGEDNALDDLLTLNVDPTYSFTPSPSQIYRQLLSSITLLYWRATLAILDTDEVSHHSSNSTAVEPGHEKEKLVEILKIIPQFGDPTPAFTGLEADDKSGKVLSLKQIESLMRVGGFIFKGITRNDIALMWSELGEAGGALWEDA